MAMCGVRKMRTWHLAHPYFRKRTDVLFMWNAWSFVLC